ncbi:DUF3011 domain-containing protein [Stenotrophomonas sp. TWI819]|uniref:DUF3011 domain-containing protein n=1 Tax=Stenotrophomonas sp. TWI819 TaxID=3136800 RepID=UPI0031CB658E
MKLLVGAGVPLWPVLLWTALLPDTALAQTGGYAGEVVRCESRDMEWVHCDIPTERGVDLIRQLSDNSCVRGSEWGTDRSGVWVTLGCRAEFRARTAVAATRADGERRTRRVVRCESNGRPQSCPVVLQGAPVRLLRQLTSLPCREGHSWGYRRNEIWVTRGCQGEFEVGAADGSGFLNVPRILVCESKSRQRRFCGAGITHGVTLNKQLSGTPCEQGSSWGWDSRGVWVDKGCRAEFAVN